MKILIASIITWSLILALPVSAGGGDYMSRNYSAYFCEPFARNAWRAAEIYRHGTSLPELLSFIDIAPVADSEKHRAFQAVQFVWKNRVDNPLMAYTLAMGLCLKPKQEMSPMAEPWLTSPRTSREHF